uniref:Putative conserved secreted protein n=1 Tax=Ixodes ricinus TaxID=34613 RepID=A0A6B0UQX2_IXORI
MKNTGLLFFIMGTTRLIVAMFVLFAICKPTVTGVGIKGAENLAPNCDKKITELCKNTTLGALKEVTVTTRTCKVTCTYQPPGPDYKIVDGFRYWNREYEDVNLPRGTPCAFGAECDNKGTCICQFCN